MSARRLGAACSVSRTSSGQIEYSAPRLAEASRTASAGEPSSGIEVVDLEPGGAAEDGAAVTDRGLRLESGEDDLRRRVAAVGDALV